MIWQSVERLGLEQLAGKRPNRQVDAEVTGGGTCCDDEHVSLELARIRSLEHLDAKRGRSANDFTGERGRIGDAVRRAEHASEHVVSREPRHDPGVDRVDSLDRNTERGLQLAALLQLGETRFRRGEEEVAHLLEPRGAELLEEGDRFLCQPYLGHGRELLPHAAHRLPRRA